MPHIQDEASGSFKGYVVPLFTIILTMLIAVDQDMARRSCYPLAGFLLLRAFIIQHDW
jgi:hypothetical protein